MKDHYHTAVQALGSNPAVFLHPDNFRVHHRLSDVTALPSLPYDLFLLDRDGTLQGYHATTRLANFESTLEMLKNKAEIISNSSFDEVRRIRDVFGDVLPIAQVVRLRNICSPVILRFVHGQLSLHLYDLPGGLTRNLIGYDESFVADAIVARYKKPDPLVVRAVVALNVNTHRVVHRPRVLMVGDRYLTDVVAGNCAGVNTALVNPVVPRADPLSLWLSRYCLDVPVGCVMSRV
ncbi:MAG: HAD hydrolase-like protein [Nanoarchaeota archaeon]|nr:HAD hydrolase-like protein [Nanoarchaeota archaeon]